LKILHATHHFWPCIGGIEASLKTLCVELTKAGQKCRVLCLNRCAYSKDRLPESEDCEGIEIVRRPFLDLKAYKIAFGFLKHAKDVDVIHVHGLGFFSDMFLLTKFLHRKPVVVSSYGGIFHTGANPLKNFYFYVWCRFLLKLADKIVVISRHDEELFLKISNRDKIVLLPVPVDLPKIQIAKKKPNTFVFVGRFSKNKRIDLLIEAFAKASEKNDAVLYIVGGDFDGLRENLELKVKTLGAKDKIIFLGMLPHEKLYEVLSKSDFFISASEYESFGVSAIEAMHAGCIPVLSSIATFEEFVQNGRNGFILDFSNSAKAAQALERIISLPKNEKEEKRKKAIKYASKFEPKNIAKSYLALYSKLLQGRRC